VFPVSSIVIFYLGQAFTALQYLRYQQQKDNGYVVDETVPSFDAVPVMKHRLEELMEITKLIYCGIGIK
jgi:hypothetical protein